MTRAPAAPRVLGAALVHATSLARPAAGIAVLLLIPPGSPSAAVLPLFVTAAATDWADGVLARRFGMGGRAGRLVDNLCDFSLLMAMFAWLAAGRAWSPLPAGLAVRAWAGANALPCLALAASFGLYFVRLLRDFAAGHEPGRSRFGHAAGVANYLLAALGAVDATPGVALPGLAVEAAMLGVVALNAVAVAENARLLFQGPAAGPKMAA